MTGNHFCTATVVHSPGRNLIVTAGHCLLAGRAGEGAATFAPAYADGRVPYGTWKIAEVFEDPRWADGTNDDYDLAFARLAPDASGRNIEDVTGAAVLDTTGRTDEQVTVTGYPRTARSRAPACPARYGSAPRNSASTARTSPAARAAARGSRPTERSSAS